MKIIPLGKNKILFSVVFLVFYLILFGWILWLELYYPFNTSKYLLIESWLIVVFLFVIRALFNVTNYSGIRQLSKRFLVFFTLIAAVHLFVYSINIYSLNRFQVVQYTCNNSESLCSMIQSAFYKSKAFRFITVSPHFVIIPLITTILAYGLFFKMPKFKKNRILLITLLLVVTVQFIFVQAVGAGQIAYADSSKILKNIGSNFDERFVIAQGGHMSHGWIKILGDLIKENTSGSDKIIVPPDRSPWEMEGNSLYIRSFIYPRYPVSFIEGKDFHKDARAVMISSGIYFGADSVWPDFIISKDKITKIIVIDRASMRKTEIADIDYDPKNFKDSWGVILLK